MPATSFDAIVIGAGIVGAACAAELASSGLRILLCEQNDYPGGGATAAGMGHLAVMDDSEAQFALTNYSQSLWRELARELPSSAEYLPCGSLWVAADDEEYAEVERKLAFYQEREVPAEKLDAQQLAEAEPGLRKGLRGALRLPMDSVCYPPCAAAHLSERLVANGGQFRTGAAVRALAPPQVTLTSGEVFHADLVVVAAGTHSKALLPDLPLKPRKGHLAITDRYPEFLKHQIIELGYLKSAHSVQSDSVAFNAQPRATGQILIGSSRQYGTEENAVEPAILTQMLRRAVEYMPPLRSMRTVRTWTGFRAATPDKLPLIGRWRDTANLYVATGHEGLGISTAPGTARLLADLILGRPPALNAAWFDPNRSFAHA